MGHGKCKDSVIFLKKNSFSFGKVFVSTACLCVSTKFVHIEESLTLFIIVFYNILYRDTYLAHLNLC